MCDVVPLSRLVLLALEQVFRFVNYLALLALYLIRVHIGRR